MISDGDVRVAGESGKGDFSLVPERRELALIGLEGEARLVVGGLWHVIRGHESRVAIESHLIECDLRLLSIGVAQHALIIALHRVDRELSLRQICFRIIECNLELTRIKPVQNLPSCHTLIVADVNALYDAGDIR
jgi:hypothetical protein